MRKVLLTSAALFLISASHASAGEKYFGLDLVKFDDFGMNLQGTVGTYIWHAGPVPIALEGRASFSVSDDDNLKISHHLGGYLRAEYPINQFRPYGLIGFTHAEGAYEEFDIEVSTTETDLSLGFGLQYNFSKGWKLNGEVLLQFVEFDDSVEVDGMSVGFRKNF